jgi:hypothetical protein
LSDVKSILPFNLRFEKKSSHSKQDYNLTSIEVPSQEFTVRELIRLAIEALPEGWQATSLPGYVILYREDAAYESADALWRKQGEVLREAAGAARLDVPGKIEEESVEEDLSSYAASSLYDKSSINS